MRKKIKISTPNWSKAVSVILFILLLGAYTQIFAISSPYEPGSTLDPECAPGDPNCTVDIGGGDTPWVVGENGISFNDGLVGIGTDNPSSLLDIQIRPTFSYEQNYYEDDGMGDSLDDATFSGVYLNEVHDFDDIYVYIDSEGIPDTFSYNDELGDCDQQHNIPITGEAQEICLGIYVTFENTTGHSLGDEWEYSIHSEYLSPFTISANEHIFLNLDINNYNFFAGYDAGYGATSASTSNFIGRRAGYGATSASSSNFIGLLAGEGATNSYDSNFIGAYSGEGATNADSANFIGSSAGNNAFNAFESNFIGYNAGNWAQNSSYSNFFGTSAGEGAINASNSIFIGRNAGYEDTVNNTGNVNDFSILIGKDTKTGGFKNSIALGGNAVNTAVNQFMIGSTTRPIDTTRWNGSSSTQCTLTTGTGIACTSDENLKTNINDLESTTLEKLLNVRTVTFNWKEGNSDKLNIGFLAQDLEKYFPELVATDKDGLKSVYYANMTPILTEAIRELNLKVENLENESQNWFSNLISNVTEFVAGIIRAKDKLCIGEGSEEVCITKEELLDIKKNAGLYHEPVAEEPVFEEPIAEEELAEEGSEIEEKPAVEETLKEQVVPVVPEVVEPEPIGEEEKEPEIPIEEKGNEPEIPEEVQIVA